MYTDDFNKLLADLGLDENILKEAEKKKRQEYRKKYYEDNKETIRANNEIWKQNNLQRYKESVVEWKKENEEYYKNHKKEYYQKHKDRLKKYAKEHRQKLLKANPDHLKDMNLRYSYGVGVDTFNDLVAKQNGGCGICGMEIVKSKKFCLDHCHKSEKVRGVLCVNCNTGIGMFKDNTETLQKAIIYLLNSKVD